jgi:hypothetical protein
LAQKCDKGKEHGAGVGGGIVEVGVQLVAGVMFTGLGGMAGLGKDAASRVALNDIVETKNLSIELRGLEVVGTRVVGTKDLEDLTCAEDFGGGSGSGGDGGTMFDRLVSGGSVVEIDWGWLALGCGSDGGGVVAPSFV